ncbi:unnamed protein product [Rhizophagus irregularis]|nr:unnamed protein product [Rhizophagus irregularis]
MLEKVKFWTIQEKMGISTQYNLLVALFSDKVINKKDLSNAIQQFKKQVKPSKNDACQMFTELYLKKDDDPRWIIKPYFDVGERRLNSLFWMSPDQVNAYGKYHDIVIIDTTSRTNQFDMILMLVIVVDNNFRNLIVAAAILEDETEATFLWTLQKLKNSCDVTPITLYSDADPALISAVKKNYPETHHFLCIFYIELNLRKKLKGKLQDQFEPFHAKFLAIRNSLCPKKFETGWEKLINEFPACEHYLTRVLYPCKKSWASFAINRNFTAGIQSTQCVEVTNRIIKEKLNRFSCLTDVVGEIQRVFDQQSKRAILSECKNEIPTRGIPSIMDEYFPNLDKILHKYLTPQILQKQRDQMVQSLCYDTVLIKDWQPLLETPNVVQLQGPKQKYGFGMGYAKKALDLAIQTDKVNEFVDQVKCFIENTKAELSEQQENLTSMHIGDLLQVQHKGRQPNRYKSCGELQRKKSKYIRNITNITNKNCEKVVENQVGKKRERHCKKCNQPGHYAPRCSNV